jgi:hypothetical protein
MIKVGDLVVVVKPTPCCRNVSLVSKVFTVENVATDRIGCLHCGAVYTVPRLGFSIRGEHFGCHTDRVIKIDPPAEGDMLETPVDEVAA